MILLIITMSLTLSKYPLTYLIMHPKERNILKKQEKKELKFTQDLCFYKVCFFMN